MISLKRQLGLAAAVGTVVFVCGLGSASAASTTPPYHDQYAVGSIGLCDQGQNSITSGSVASRPFVWRAVGSAPAPATYQGAHQQATLFAFQPRQGVNPVDWSGDSLTAASVYSNVGYPMAQSTSSDLSLAQYLSEYPATWNGYVELRLYYSAPNAGTAQTYAATDIQVTGGSWSVVRGATGPCSAGTAVSSENLVPKLLRPKVTPSPGTASPTRSPRSPSPSASVRPSPTLSPSSYAAAPAGGGTGSSARIEVAAAAALVALIAGLALLRRRGLMRGGAAR